MRLARESVAQEETDSQNVDLETAMAEVDDDKTFAAMGIAKTIGTVNSGRFASLCSIVANSFLFVDHFFPRERVRCFISSPGSHHSNHRIYVRTQTLR